MKRLSVNLQEPSTWRGVIYVVTAAGAAAFPELAVKITAAGFMLSGVVGILFSDKPYDGPVVDSLQTK